MYLLGFLGESTYHLWLGGGGGGEGDKALL